MHAVLKNFKPLVFENSNILLLSKRNKIYRFYLNSKKIENLTNFPFSIKNWFFSLHSFIARLVRSDVRNAIRHNSFLYFTRNGNIWFYNLLSNNAQLKKIYKFHRGSMPLNYTVIDSTISNKIGVNEGVYFGEYFANPQMNSVNIFRIYNSSVQLVYTFPQNLINHIHNIVCDEYRNCIWILAGDFDHGASIWKTDNGFRSVECVSKGNQAFRSCVAFPIYEGLLYLTDSQYIPNELRLLTESSNFKQSIVLSKINGPCIYGTEISGVFYFSTATEPISKQKFSIRDFISTKPGPGVIFNRSEVCKINTDLSVSLLFYKRKDFLPYYLAQFGNILFPSGINNSNYLVTYSIGNVSNDQCTEIRNINYLNEL